LKALGVRLAVMKASGGYERDAIQRPLTQLCLLLGLRGPLPQARARLAHALRFMTQYARRRGCASFEARAFARARQDDAVWGRAHALAKSGLRRGRKAVYIPNRREDSEQGGLKQKYPMGSPRGHELCIEV
jgi:hypothetical protein